MHWLNYPYFQTYQPPDRRTQQEQMNDLLNEISEEVQLDSRLPDPETEIAARLARLKGQGTEKQGWSDLITAL